MPSINSKEERQTQSSLDVAPSVRVVEYSPITSEQVPVVFNKRPLTGLNVPFGTGLHSFAASSKIVPEGQVHKPFSSGANESRQTQSCLLVEEVDNVVEYGPSSVSPHF